MSKNKCRRWKKIQAHKCWLSESPYHFGKGRVYITHVGGRPKLLGTVKAFELFLTDQAGLDIRMEKVL